jgi:hypothetical protein
MFPQIITVPGIFFHVRDPLTSELVSWRRDVDEAVMRYQLGRRSQILVCGLQDQGMTHITEMPERGKFMPYYGMIGGGFTFIFHPAGELTEITVETVASENPLLHPEPIEPLKLSAPDLLLTQAEVYENIGTVSPDDTMTYLPEFLFGFYGEFLDMFHKWEWYSEDVEKYDFIFVPTSVGTMVNVRHQESGSILDLTRDVSW